jgi:hypothetical protein
MGYKGCNIISATESCCKIKWYSHIVYYTGDKYWYFFSITQRREMGSEQSVEVSQFSEIERGAYTYID